MQEALNKLNAAGTITKVVQSNDLKSALDCTLYDSMEGIDAAILLIEDQLPSNLSSSRILEEVATVPTASVGEPNDNVIYVKPDALFGLGLSLFIFFVAYVGVMCLFNTNCPTTTPRKPFKFGREL